MGNEARSLNKMLGPDTYEFLDASLGDATASTILDSTCLWMDTGGIIKIDYKDEGDNTVTEVFECPTQQYVPKERIVNLHRYYVATTQGTGKSWSSAGVETTNAIKIYKNTTT